MKKLAIAFFLLIAMTFGSYAENKEFSFTTGSYFNNYPTHNYQRERVYTYDSLYYFSAYYRVDFLDFLLFSFKLDAYNRFTAELTSTRSILPTNASFTFGTGFFKEKNNTIFIVGYDITFSSPGAMLVVMPESFSTATDFYSNVYFRVSSRF